MYCALLRILPAVRLQFDSWWMFARTAFAGHSSRSVVFWIDSSAIGANVNSIFQFSYIKSNCSICKNEIALWPFHRHANIFLFISIDWCLLFSLLLLWLLFLFRLDFRNLCVSTIFEADAAQAAAATTTATAPLLYLYQAQLKFIKILL